MSDAVGQIVPLARAIELVVAGCAIVPLTPRERELGHIPANHELVARAAIYVPRLKRLYAIRAEQENDRRT